MKIISLVLLQSYFILNNIINVYCDADENNLAIKRNNQRCL